MSDDHHMKLQAKSSVFVHICDTLNALLLLREHIITAIRQVGPSERVPALGTVAGITIV